MKIESGTELIVKGLRWHEAGWEFDCPVMLLSPVIRYSPNGESIEEMVESLLLGATIDEKLETHDYSKEFDYRGWRLAYLNKVWNSAIKGKKYPKKNYQAEEWGLIFSFNQQEYGLVGSMEKIR